MNTLFSWLAESAAGLTIMYIVYKIFLKNEAFFMANRVYLLSAMIFSLLLPLISFGIPAGPVHYSYFIPEVVAGQGNYMPAAPGHEAPGFISVFYGIYLSGVLFLLLRMIHRLIQFYRFTGRYKTRNFRGMNIVNTDMDIAPFSFMNYIILNESLYNPQEKERILEHETAHIRQMHTFDLILAEVMIILQWFNPVVWLYKSSLEEIHEYLADREVISGGTSIPFYQALLLNLQIGARLFPVVNSFNNSLTKNRITMMTKMTPPAGKRLRFLLMIPALAIMVLMCGKYEEEKSTMINFGDILNDGQGTTADGASDEVFFIVENMPSFQGGGQDQFRRYIAENLVYPQVAAENGISGRVFVQFTVKADGTVADAKIVRSADPALDNEAIRVVMSSPLWEPGSQRGIPVNVAFTFPINFVLNDGKEE